MCPNTSRQPATPTQCIPVASRAQPSLSPVQSGQWPFPSSCSHENTWHGSPAARQVCRGSGQTDAVWDGQAPLAGMAKLLLSAPGSLARLGSICSPGCPSSLPARAGLLCLWKGEGTVDLQRGKETAVQLIQSNDILQNRHVLYIL